MSETPLSDIMSEYAEIKTLEGYERFLELFRSSTIGIVATGTVTDTPHGNFTADGSLGAGKTTYGDGRSRILAYADPEAALSAFGPVFNAGVAGEVLLQMAATDPDCEGILVNSGIREICMAISKSTAQEMLMPTATETP
ncbi:hypothetical protein OG777_14995 [Micromonospora peucetia]|uniref:SseB protein N-terminal domain-containing protein n=1 Tax=Micromonospora peucetia TaxID=47871 RepID=A0A1C6VUE3_9ACTN|nr:hypothetical protein [Micromonospora peucetia]MCX4388228.1 hypothetical protein [Micromonospora peucetia]WSA31093.1 hypothetical protein OIE14_23480 [Micromonospora peucetia]SCL69520.1 hypothetical protein GA0070608_4038 [Micromonospora peucetia]